MLLFQPPPPTRYDLNFSIFGIPVRVHPLFWLVAAVLGSATIDVIQILMWVIVVFVSILVHELGHALAMRRYGQHSRIVLHFAGGLTIPEPVSWGNTWANVGFRPNQEIFISFAGPLAGFLFAGLVILSVIIAGGMIDTTWLLGIFPVRLVALLPFGGRVISVFATMLLWVNIFWGLINLVPVYPLDGGNITRYAMLKSDPMDGVRKSLWISVIAGAIMVVVSFAAFGSIFMALLFGFLAFSSYQTLQGRRIY